MTGVAAVAVVIPAHNAAATLGQTLDSVLAQTVAGWEAIVVDDGSTDDTGAIAESYAARDRRIRVAHQARAGEGAARNAGVAGTAGEWLLFLDADDWIAPNAIERFLTAGANAPEADAVAARCSRVTPDGTVAPPEHRADLGALFPAAACYCPFPAPHSCLVRRAPLRDLGGFTAGLPVGADWDFWQRLARTGARCVGVDDVLAFYRMRPGSAVTNVMGLVESGIRLIRLGHGPDPRVQHPDPRYAHGMDSVGVDHALLRFISWPAGMLLGSGGDARSILAWLGAVRAPELSADEVARSIFHAAVLPRGRPLAAWAELWPTLEGRLSGYLAALEALSGATQLARRARESLEREISLGGPAVEPVAPAQPV